MAPPVDPVLRPLVILGNTAGGKSELAVALAERLASGGEVIGADSMQVYRRMDAGTAKPTAAQRQRVPHHLIDVVEPIDPFSVHDWLVRAEAAIAAIRSRGKRPIVVGGTNLYLKALLEGLFDGPRADPAFRASLDGVAAPQLHERLGPLDPEAAARIAPNDRKRLVRALEVHHVTGRPLSEHQTQWADAASADYRFDPILLGLQWPTDAINRRINLRVKAMFEPGKVEPELAAEVCPNGESLPDEARRLDAAGLLGEQAREALGYKQVLTLPDPDEAFERTKILTRRFAKQQRTWMRRFRGVRWIEMPCEDVVSRALDDIAGRVAPR